MIFHDNTMTGITIIQRITRNMDFNKSEKINITYNQYICEQIYKESKLSFTDYELL